MSQQDLAIPLSDLINCISDSIDLVNPQIISHHKRVTYIALSLAKQMGYSETICDDLFIATQLHDIGAIASSSAEKSELLNFELEKPHLHSLVGYLLLTKFDQFAQIANIVRCHHVAWNNGMGNTFLGQPVPELSHIVHLADRVDILIKNNQNVIDQIERIRSTILKLRGSRFKPEIVDAFLNVSTKEAFWLDIVSPNIKKNIATVHPLTSVNISTEKILNVSNFISHLIDFRSRFTATHSSGVAACAAKLGELVGMSEQDINHLKIAGFLHDLGKMAVPKEILEKAAPLTHKEFNIIRQHSYLTKRILDNVRFSRDVNHWASFHHEHLDQSGYPFHYGAEHLDLGARIIAVADIFTALLEDRPYRKGMQQAEVTTILKKAVEDLVLDQGIVDHLLFNFAEINEIRNQVQENAIQAYQDFWNEVDALLIPDENEIETAVLREGATH